MRQYRAKEERGRAYLVRTQRRWSIRRISFSLLRKKRRKKGTYRANIFPQVSHPYFLAAASLGTFVALRLLFLLLFPSPLSCPAIKSLPYCCGDPDSAGGRGTGVLGCGEPVRALEGGGAGGW